MPSCPPVASRGDRTPPFVYSNLGFGLLGHALSRRAGVDYGTLVRQVITGPLGMTDTVVELSPEQQRRFLQGYNDDRQPVPPWDVDVLAGAGALRSTAPDMLAWLEANLHPERLRAGTLSAALVSSQQVRADLGFEPRPRTRLDGRQRLGHLSAWRIASGFTADAFFNPKDDVAVIVLSNVGPGTAVSADVLGEHVRARLDGRPAVSLAEVTIPADRRRAFMDSVAWRLLVHDARGRRVHLRPRHERAGRGGMRCFRAVISCASRRFCSWARSASLSVRTFFSRCWCSPEPFWRRNNGGVSCVIPLVLVPRFVSGTQRIAGPRASGAQRLGGSGTGRLRNGHRVRVCRTSARFGGSRSSRTSRLRWPALRWLPAFGDGLQTAVVQFSVRTMFRSAPHRVILAFYWGMGFALAIIFLKSPRGQQLAEASGVGAWHETSVPLLVSSIV